MSTSHTASATLAGPTQKLFKRRTGKEIVSEYNSDSNPASDYYSDSSYEFDFGADPDEP
jgi:hypothetical protein